MIEPLNSKDIIAVLNQKSLKNLSHLEIFKTLPSTNSYLLEKTISPADSGWVCFAEQQTTGRGRRGRAWHSEPTGNLYGSLLWYCKNLTDDWSSLGIAMGVTVLNALKKFGVNSGLTLKWPNDILFDGRKLAGILLERRNHFMVIGIGINVVLPTDTTLIQVADLQEIFGKKIPRNFLAGTLINELFDNLAIYENSGLQTFMPIWRHYDALYQKEIYVHTATETVTGIMQGITDQGELQLLDAQQQLQIFPYGEVSARLQG